MRISDWSSDVCSSDLIGFEEIGSGCLKRDPDHAREFLAGPFLREPIPRLDVGVGGGAARALAIARRIGIEIEGSAEMTIGIDGGIACARMLVEILGDQNIGADRHRARKSVV